MLRLSARLGRPVRRSAAHIAPCWAAALRPACPARRSELRRRLEELAVGPGRPLAARQAGLRQRARQPEVFLPGVRAEALRHRRGLVSVSGPGLYQVRVSVPHPGARAGASRHRAPAWWLEREWHLEPVIRQPGACRDVRPGVYRAVQPALRQACCPELVSRSAQVLLTVQVWRSGQAHPGGPSVRPAMVLPLVWDGPQEPPRAVVLAA